MQTQSRDYFPPGQCILHNTTEHDLFYYPDRVGDDFYVKAAGAVATNKSLGQQMSSSKSVTTFGPVASIAARSPDEMSNVQIYLGLALGLCMFGCFCYFCVYLFVRDRLRVFALLVQSVCRLLAALRLMLQQQRYSPTIFITIDRKLPSFVHPSCWHSASSAI